jgi:hypothetical protein
MSVLEKTFVLLPVYGRRPRLPYKGQTGTRSGGLAAAHFNLKC